MRRLVFNTLSQDDMRSDSDVAFYATVYADWTILQLANGDSFGFNRQTGRVYKIPHDECPFFVMKPPRYVPTAPNGVPNSGTAT